MCEKSKKNAEKITKIMKIRSECMALGQNIRVKSKAPASAAACTDPCIKNIYLLLLFVYFCDAPVTVLY